MKPAWLYGFIPQPLSVVGLPIGHSCYDFYFQIPQLLDLPTSRAQIFHEREAQAVDFLMFSAAKASRWGQLPGPEIGEARDFEKLRAL